MPPKIQSEKPNPMRFVNETNVGKMLDALSRLLSDQYGADITITATPKVHDKHESDCA